MDSAASAQGMDGGSIAHPIEQPSHQAGSALRQESHSPSQPSGKCPKVRESGITVLWEPNQRRKIIADIIFVHGLGGHPQTTWEYGRRAKGSQPDTPTTKLKKRQRVATLFRKKDRTFREQTDRPPEALDDAPSPSFDMDHDAGAPARKAGTYCYWPYDLISAEFDNVRVMSYGYDSNPTHFYCSLTVQMTISQHAQQLLQAVTDARAKCRGRPTIFVAHSLGGILVKDALIESKKFEYQPSQLDLAKSCSAIIFFGTPHQGSNAAAYGEFLASVVSALPLSPSVNKDILRGLKPDGEKIAMVTADFNNILNDQIPVEEKIQIYSFREGKPMTNVSKFDGKVKF